MVNFVGAGPGAVDLITVRGNRLLSEADVIIYAGSLVNEELLKVRKENSKVYNSAEMTLEQVMEVIFEAERNNLMTVRLHTGDSSLYGAIKEQIDILEGNNISYDICPGVSSFCAAAAALKTEYTLPDVSQTVIITRMEGKTKVPDRERIEQLAKHQSAMVIFLSASMLDKLSQRLIEGGYSEDTAAAIVYKASWQDEKVIHCTVAQLYQKAQENNIKKTALIIVGDFLDKSYSRSKLYDPSFETEFRKAENSIGTDEKNNFFN